MEISAVAEITVINNFAQSSLNDFSNHIIHDPYY